MQGVLYKGRQQETKAEYAHKTLSYLKIHFRGIVNLSKNWELLESY